MAKKKKPTTTSTPTTAAKPAATAPAAPPAAKRPMGVVWLIADCLLAIVALGQAAWAVSAGRGQVVAAPPFVVQDSATTDGEAAVRIDDRNQLTVRGKPCPGVSAGVLELTSGGAPAEVRIVASGEAPCATVAALVEALRRRGIAAQVVVAR